MEMTQHMTNEHALITVANKQALESNEINNTL